MYILTKAISAIRNYAIYSILCDFDKWAKSDFEIQISHPLKTKYSIQL